MAKEDHPKFNPRPGWGLNPGPSGWQSEILPTVPASHTLHQLHTHCLCVCLSFSFSQKRDSCPLLTLSVFICPSACLPLILSVALFVCVCLSVSHSLSLPCLSVWLSICFLFTLSFSLFDNVFNDRVARLCNNLHEETSY